MESYGYYCLVFETLCKMRRDDIIGGVEVLWSSVGWNHVFKNALTLLRIGGRSRRTIDTTIERGDSQAFAKLSSSYNSNLSR